MNAGTIWGEGRADAAGYAMRGGTLMIRGDVGYRAGVHMKAFGDSYASIVIGGTAGSFWASTRQAARSWCWVWAHRKASRWWRLLRPGHVRGHIYLRGISHPKI